LLIWYTKIIKTKTYTFNMQNPIQISSFSSFFNFNQIFATKIGFYNLNFGEVVWIIATTVFALIGILIFNLLIVRKLAVFNSKNPKLDSKISLINTAVHKINEIGNPFYISAILASVGKYAQIEPLTSNFFVPAFLIIAGYYLTGILRPLLVYIFSKSLIKVPDEETDKATVQILNIIIGLTLWVSYFLFVCKVLNFNLTLILGSISLSSVAVAFAAQNVFADMFATFTIYVDKPFVVGDQIVIDSFTGTVKRVGLKSTRLKLLDGDELVVSNKELTNAKIRNLKQITFRKVVERLVLVNSPDGSNFDNKTAKKAREILIKIINEIDQIQLRRVTILQIEPDGVTIEYIYNIPNQDNSEYMRTQELINLKVLEQFEEAKIKLIK
jgi:small-conductance mechanosensitive channel